MAAIEMTGFRPEDRIAYVKAGRSNQLDDNNCVVLGLDKTGAVALGHSKHPEKEPFRFTLDEVRAFVQGARDGDFDHLIA